MAKKTSKKLTKKAAQPVENPPEISRQKASNLIEGLIEVVKQCLDADYCMNIKHVSKDYPQGPGEDKGFSVSPVIKALLSGDLDEAEIESINKMWHRRQDAIAQIRNNGSSLAKALQFHDQTDAAKAVLLLVHYCEHGGGVEAIRKAWTEIKITLQMAAAKIVQTEIDLKEKQPDGAVAASRLLALNSLRFVVREAGWQLVDKPLKEAHARLNSPDIKASQDNPYLGAKVPNFETWSRYVREAAKGMGKTTKEFISDIQEKLGSAYKVD